MKQELERLGKDKYLVKRLATKASRHPTLKGIKYIGYMIVTLIMAKQWLGL